MSAKDAKLTLSQILLPLVVVSFTLFLMLAFQMMQNLRDRDALHQMKAQQDKPFEDVQKLQSQLSALALGTKKLADGGDKNAQGIIAQLKQAGIVVGNPPAGAAAPAAPAAAAPAATPAEGAAVPVAPKPAVDQP